MVESGELKGEWRRRKACRDGVLSRKRNLDAVREREERLGEEAGMMAATKKARQNTFQPLRTSSEHALGSTDSTKRLTAILSLSSSALRGQGKQSGRNLSFEARWNWKWELWIIIILLAVCGCLLADHPTP